MQSFQNIYLGTWQLSRDFGLVSEDEALEVLRYSLSLGVRHFDTAYVYGDGKVEKMMGEILPIETKIVTKIPAISKPSAGVGAITDYYPDDWMKHCFTTSLDRLKRRAVYGVLLHNWSNGWNHNFEKVFSFLLDLKEKEIVEKIGISIPNGFQGNLPDDVVELIDIIEAPRNVENNWIDNEITNLQINNIEIILRSIFMQGKVFEPSQELLLVRKILTKALQTNCSVVVGMTKKQHILENVKIFKEVMQNE